MKLRVTFEPRQGFGLTGGVELEAEKFEVHADTGWVDFFDANGQRIVCYPPGVIRSIANVGAMALATAQVRPPAAPEPKRENSRRQQKVRQAPAP